MLVPFRNLSKLITVTVTKKEAFLIKKTKKEALRTMSYAYSLIDHVNHVLRTMSAMSWGT